MSWSKTRCLLRRWLRLVIRRNFWDSKCRRYALQRQVYLDQTANLQARKRRRPHRRLLHGLIRIWTPTWYRERAQSSSHTFLHIMILFEVQCSIQKQNRHEAFQKKFSPRFEARSPSISSSRPSLDSGSQHWCKVRCVYPWLDLNRYKCSKLR